MSSAPRFSLTRNPFGRLVFTGDDGHCCENVVPVRAFPISDPQQGIALVDPHGHELAWIENLHDLADEARQLLEEELASREFMPRIQRIHRVSSFATPSTWEIDTHHGATELVLKGEEDIRRLASPALLIADSHGIHYLIPDRFALDPHSRKLLDRFL